jgi:hypothetical protein
MRLSPKIWGEDCVQWRFNMRRPICGYFVTTDERDGRMYLGVTMLPILKSIKIYVSLLTPRRVSLNQQFVFVLREYISTRTLECLT